MVELRGFSPISRLICTTHWLELIHLAKAIFGPLAGQGVGLVGMGILPEPHSATIWIAPENSLLRALFILLPTTLVWARRSLM